MLFNPLDIISEIEFFQYILGAFGFYGISLCVQKLILGGNRV